MSHTAKAVKEPKRMSFAKIAGGCVSFVKKNAVLFIAMAAAVITSIIIPPDKAYADYFDYKTLACLFSVLAVVCALKNINFFYMLARKVVQLFKNARMSILALVYITFIGSMLIANDMALLTFLPLGYFVLTSTNMRKYMAFTFIMQNIAANLGGMLTPFGNPQNLYLYSKFNIPNGEFMSIMAPPFCLSIVLITICCIIFVKPEELYLPDEKIVLEPKRTVAYMLLFALALMLAVGEKLDFLPLAFDSGGVTTGPITVPFIMALGVGISGVLGDKHSRENSFGLVALCSIGPILAVLVLGIVSQNQLSYTVPDYSVSTDIFGSFLHTAGHTAKEVALALGLIVVFFLVCQIAFLRLGKRQLLRIAVGVLFTYAGLVLFLTSVNVGFMPMGYKLGLSLAGMNKWLVVGLGLLMGILVVLAEPAIHILNAQVEQITGGYVRKRSMMTGLCIGVGAAIGLSVVRIIFDFSLVYYIIPGYFISLALSLFVPPVYTAIAFDSGGVASGPMTSGFILPFAVGVCVGTQGADAVLRDAFGVVAMVAMIPLITIQLLGFRAIVSNRLQERKAMKRILGADDQQIINFM